MAACKYTTEWITNDSYSCSKLQQQTWYCQTTMSKQTASNFYQMLAGGLGTGATTIGASANTVYGQVTYAQGQLFTNWFDVSTLYSMLMPSTPEEQAARDEAARIAAAKREAAKLRAENLLFTILTPTQVKQYTDDDFVELMVKDRLYRIGKGYSRNVLLMENGKPVARFCAHPNNAYQTPVPDAMLAQILMLKTNEAEFLRLANRSTP